LILLGITPTKSSTTAPVRLRIIREFLAGLDRRFPAGIPLEYSAAIRHELEPLVHAAIDETAEAEHALPLERYFKAEYAEGKIDHVVRASVHDDVVEIYIHPSGRDGRTTPTLIVEGNYVRPKYPTT
jgi:hypothetical protein